MKIDREHFKKRTYEIVEASHENDVASKAYDVMMFVAVIVGLVPLTIKGESSYTRTIDLLTALVFFSDYMFRLYTADYKMGIKCKEAYIAYFLSPMALIDLFSIVPVMCLFFPNSSTFGLFRIIRVLRLFKLIRYSKAMVTISNVIRKVKKQLIAVLTLVIIYILACSLVIFQLEPELFDSFFDAIYWATISITTIGYGDIAPTTDIGRIITMLSSLVGMAVIALPTGLITAAYTDEIKRQKGRFEL